MLFSRLSLVTGAAALLLLSGALTLLPFASAQSTVTASIPVGASAGSKPGFSPGAITVFLGVNNTVTWTNNDIAAHTVTPSNVPSPGSWSVGSGNLDVGKSYSFTFTIPGTYNYTCSYHNWMFGSVIVKALATTSATTSKSTSTTTSTTTNTTTSTKTSTTPEFPTAALGAILFVVMAALIVLAPRLRTSGQPGFVP